MISVEDLADLLNSEIDDDAMKAIIDLWQDCNSPFDLEHPDISPALERICEMLNEKLGLQDFEPEE